jgi:hypothetical protein
LAASTVNEIAVAVGGVELVVVIVSVEIASPPMLVKDVGLNVAVAPVGSTAGF